MDTSQLYPQYAVRIAEKVVARRQAEHKIAFDKHPDTYPEWTGSNYNRIWSVAFEAAKEVRFAMIMEEPTKEPDK